MVVVVEVEEVVVVEVEEVVVVVVVEEVVVVVVVVEVIEQNLPVATQSTIASPLVYYKSWRLEQYCHTHRSKNSKMPIKFPKTVTTHLIKFVRKITISFNRK